MISVSFLFCFYCCQDKNIFLYFSQNKNTDECCQLVADFFLADTMDSFQKGKAQYGRTPCPNLCNPLA